MASPAHETEALELGGRDLEWEAPACRPTTKILKAQPARSVKPWYARPHQCPDNIIRIDVLNQQCEFSDEKTQERGQDSRLRYPQLSFSSVETEGADPSGRAARQGDLQDRLLESSEAQGSGSVQGSESLSAMTLQTTASVSYSPIRKLFSVSHKSIPIHIPPWLPHLQNEEAATVLTAAGMMKQGGRDLKVQAEVSLEKNKNNLGM